MLKPVNDNYFRLYDFEYQYIKPLGVKERGLLLTAIFEYCLKGCNFQSLAGETKNAYSIITARIDKERDG